MSAAFVRLIRISGGSGEVRASLIDDFHHFRVRLLHESNVVTGIQSQALRFPWSLCPKAGDELGQILGHVLADDAAALPRTFNARLQCTHQFDLASLALTAAARNDKSRTYRAMVPDRVDGRTQAVLEVDGAKVLNWCVEGSLVTSPENYRGCNLDKQFMSWAVAHLLATEVEPALVLRRSVFVSSGRAIASTLDSMVHPPQNGGCWVQQPKTATVAERKVGSVIKFDERRFQEINADETWLAFGA